MSEEIEVNSAEELLEESLKVLSDQKETKKALKDSIKSLLEQTGGDKYFWGIVRKVYSAKGDGWVGGDPLNIDPNSPSKDAISNTFKKLAETIKAFSMFNRLEDLQEYFDALRKYGIEITVDESATEHADTSAVDIEDYLKSQKSYTKTIEEYSTELKESHAPKSEEIDFAPKKEYMGLVNIYKRGLEGKDVEDQVQDKLTICEWTERAYNLVKDKIDSTVPGDSDNL